MNVVWHARGMPEDGCSTVSDGRGPSRVRNGWIAVFRRRSKRSISTNFAQAKTIKMMKVAP
jgi:hypothetical protein